MRIGRSMPETTLNRLSSTGEIWRTRIADIASKLLRYGLVGLAANGIGYVAYLIITAIGLEPKLAMTLLYLLGAGIGFLGNRAWTFRDRGRVWPTLWRYGAAHGIGYVTNFLLLFIFVDRLGYPHQFVQAAAILIVALVLFVCFNLFVFRAPKAGADA